MNWDDTPSTLNTELFEECSSDDGVGGGESVRVEKGSAEDSNADDADTSSNAL